MHEKPVRKWAGAWYDYKDRSCSSRDFKQYQSYVANIKFLVQSRKTIFSPYFSFGEGGVLAILSQNFLSMVPIFSSSNSLYKFGVTVIFDNSGSLMTETETKNI